MGGCNGWVGGQRMQRKDGCLHYSPPYVSVNLSPCHRRKADDDEVADDEDDDFFYASATERYLVRTVRESSPFPSTRPTFTNDVVKPRDAVDLTAAAVALGAQLSQADKEALTEVRLLLRLGFVFCGWGLP